MWGDDGVPVGFIGYVLTIHRLTHQASGKRGKNQLRRTRKIFHVEGNRLIGRCLDAFPLEDVEKSVGYKVVNL